VLVSELEGLLRAHSFLQVERPPELWEPDAELESFVRLLGEMIAAALVRNEQELGEVTLNVSNVVVDESAADPMPAGEFVAVTIRSAGDWRPETTWHPGGEHDGSLVSGDLESALSAASASWAYTRDLYGEGSVTVLFARVAG
jgi:hypothetical protein